MWIQEKYKKLKSYSKKGIIKKIDLNISDKSVSSKADLKVLAKKSAIEVVDGKNTVIVSDEIGFNGSVVYDILFAEDVFIMVLKKGTVYLKDKNEKIYSLNAKNKLDDFSGDKKSIEWKDREGLLEYCFTLIKGYYNTDGKIQTEEYLYNMIMSVNSSFYPHENRLFNFKISDHDYSPACGKFNFEKKEKAAYVDRGFVDYEDDLLKTPKRKKKEDYSDSYEVDDDIPDYEEEEESNLHEIEVYEEYVDEDSEDY